MNYITRDAVEAALAEFFALGQQGFLHKYRFGPARDYFVQDPLTGSWADSKAIVGAAYGYRFPDRGPLGPRDFSGGEARVVRLLRELGFNVASAAEAEEAARPADQAAWSRAEVELIVADYLNMLALELAGQAYRKSAHRRALLPLLRNRTEPSIEFKHRNISSVMLELGYPTLRGYLPAPNRQKLITEVVEHQLAKAKNLDALSTAFIETRAVPLEGIRFDKVMVSPPARREVKAREPAAAAFRPVKRDYLEREARNSSLGNAGELFILQFEQWRLSEAGLGQLADKVRHVSQEDGDGAGYDILSFDYRGDERFLEVKTTAFGELTPFYVSATEARFARQEVSRFTLCRIYDFRKSPRFFELQGPIEQHCRLDPTTYRASLF
ncbi:DUF3883 domain-containing protein [Ramlibacter sp.]|uniref:DUF3883 domain-containing protein n=1 Tax=Ramlibacter sp. TaxID=1917967 RepID=UPI0035AE055A